MIDRCRPGDGLDLDHAVRRFAAFHAASVWRDVPLDGDALSAFLAGLMETGAVFLSDRGLIGGTVVPFYFAPQFKVGAELFWYDPGHEGQALREAFETWAREQGASAVQFSAMGDDHLPAVTRLYRRAGFEPVETAFVKRF